MLNAFGMGVVIGGFCQSDFSSGEGWRWGASQITVRKVKKCGDCEYKLLAL